MSKNIRATFAFTPADVYSINYADSASFGADFYTYQYEATQIAANNVATLTNGLGHVAEKLALYSGCFFVIVGLLITLHYAKLVLMSTEEKVVEDNQTECIIPEEVPSEEVKTEEVITE